MTRNMLAGRTHRDGSPQMAALLVDLREHLLQDLLATSWTLAAACDGARASGAERERLSALRAALARDIARVYDAIEALQETARDTHGPARRGARGPARRRAHRAGPGRPVSAGPPTETRAAGD